MASRAQCLLTPDRASSFHPPWSHRHLQSALLSHELLLFHRKPTKCLGPHCLQGKGQSLKAWHYRTFWMIESLPVFPCLSPSPVPLLPWSLQSGSPLCRRFPNVLYLLPACLSPACLVSSCGSAWAQSHPQAGCWSHSSGLLPITVDCNVCLCVRHPHRIGCSRDTACLTHLVLIVAQFGATFRVGAQMFVCRALCSLYLRQSPKDLEEASQGWGGHEAKMRMRIYQSTRYEGPWSLHSGPAPCSLPWPLQTPHLS